MKYPNSLGKLVERTWSKIENLLKKKGFNTIILDSDSTLRKFIDETIPKNCIVGLGNSLTSSGFKIKEMLLERGNKVYYSWNGESYNRSLDTFEEHPKPDFLLTTADTITPEGKLISHEISNKAAKENQFPENIIAFSDIKNINKPVEENLNEYIIFDEKPATTRFTVAIFPVSKAS
jgi:hypothetical protein